MAIAMPNLTRRQMIFSATAVTLAALGSTIPAGAAAPPAAHARRKRVLIGSHGSNGILWYDWNEATGELTAASVARENSVGGVARNLAWGRVHLLSVGARLV
jgi:hypothetical protein